MEITFNAQKREKAGKGAARACRREGRIRAVFLPLFMAEKKSRL